MIHNAVRQSKIGIEEQVISINRNFKQIITPNVAAALGKSEVSDRNAALILFAYASTLRLNVGEVVISHSKINRRRQIAHIECAEIVKKYFKVISRCQACNNCPA